MIITYSNYTEHNMLKLYIYLKLFSLIDRNAEK